MVARAWYAGLFVLCAYFVRLGLWPSLLSLPALLALPLGGIALVGLVSPSALARRPRIVRFARVGSGVLAVAFALNAAWFFWSQRRVVTLVVDNATPRVVRVIYGVTDGSPKRLRWHREFEVPASGLVLTRYSRDAGWYRPPNEHPLRVRIGRTPDVTVVATWVRGGFARGTPCHLSFDEYLIGRASAPAPAEFGVRPESWLDSLPAWGVTCRDGRLFAAESPGAVDLGTPTEVCHYERGGSMQCWNPRATP